MFWRLKFHFFDKHQVSAWLCGTSSLLRLFRTETNSWNCVKISCLPRSGTPGWLLHLNAFTHGSNSVIYLHSNFSDITSLVTNPSLSLSIDLKSASNGVSFKKFLVKFSPNIWDIYVIPPCRSTRWGRVFHQNLCHAVKKTPPPLPWKGRPESPILINFRKNWERGADVISDPEKSVADFAQTLKQA